MHQLETNLLDVGALLGSDTAVGAADPVDPNAAIVDPNAAINAILDVLIDQQRRLFELYAARSTVIDGRAGAALTLILAIASVTVTAVKSLNVTGPDQKVALVGYGALVLAVIIVLIERTVAGLRRSTWHRLSSDSQRTCDADARLDEFVSLNRRQRPSARCWLSKGSTLWALLKRCTENEKASDLEPGALFKAAKQEATFIDSIDVRLRVLEVWRARTANAHTAATQAARWTAVATFSVVIGLGCLAWFGGTLILG